MPTLLQRQNAEQSQYRSTDILFISLATLFLALIAGFLMYKGYTYVRHRKGSRDTKASSYRPNRTRRPWDLPSRSDAHHADLAGQAEVSLVGVWMSDDINPKLIHRIPLSDADPKTLEKFVDKQGYLYVFSDPELENSNGESTTIGIGAPVKIPAVPDVVVFSSLDRKSR